MPDVTTSYGTFIDYVAFFVNLTVCLMNTNNWVCRYTRYDCRSMQVMNGYLIKNDLFGYLKILLHVFIKLSQIVR